MSAADWFGLLHHELLLFAGVFFLIGAIDEFLVDLAYGWLRVFRRTRERRVPEQQLLAQPLLGRCAVFIPAWQEEAVIAATIRHALDAWREGGLRLYIGCYSGDSATIAAAMGAAAGDPRLRIVVHDVEGPTCKADCLNRLYRALQLDELRFGRRVRMVVLQDAEDMVDPLALHVLDRGMDEAEFIQLPVLALPDPLSPWISGHYCDEFAEAHAKTLVVREALGAAIPGAGVGCAIDRVMLERLDRSRSGDGPFAAGALTEDYELGQLVPALGGQTKYLRLRTSYGRLIATRAYFPGHLGAAVRQKTRWVHGIALQGWDRLGWSGGLANVWMQLRDRRGPFAAVLLAMAYLLIVTSALRVFLEHFGLVERMSLSSEMTVLLWANIAAMGWRVLLRAIFTAREHGIAQGFLAIPRVIVSNTIAIIAGRRALAAYGRSLGGTPPAWDKTDHARHPAHLAPAGARA